MTHWTNYKDAECECDHTDFDYDLLTNRASCTLCNYSWYLSDTERQIIRELEDINLSDLPPSTVVCRPNDSDEIPF